AATLAAEPLRRLETLRLDGWHGLRALPGAAFRGLSRLRRLSLSFCPRLRALPADAFSGLEALEELRLVQDGFSSLALVAAALSPLALPSLRALDLSENPLAAVAAGDLAPLAGSPLRELRLDSCQLDFVHSAALSPLRNLSTLSLSGNALNESTLTELVSALVEGNSSLRVLELSGAGFQKRPPAELLSAVGRSGVTNLSLAGNRFQTLSAGAFPGMPRLRHLDLRDVAAVSVQEGALHPALLPRLQTLLLGGNSLPGASAGCLLPQLRSLDLSANSREKPSPSVFALGENSFAHMHNLSYLNLSYNNIHFLLKDTFGGLTNLDEELSLKHGHISRIEVGAFHDLNKLRFLTLEDNRLSRTNLTAGVFRGLDSLEVLLLGNCGITHLAGDPSVFVHLVSLQYLSLERNAIHSISGAVFAPLTNLLGIDLSHNELESWKRGRVFDNNTRLDTVLLSFNRMTYLSPAMLDDFSGRARVELGDNPFICYAPLYKNVREWLSANGGSAGNLSGEAAPACYSPDAWRDRNLSQFLQALLDGTAAPVKPSAWWPGAVGGSLLVLVLLVAAVCYNQRAYLRYWLFLARTDLLGRSCAGRSDRALQSYTNYQYDAFVSYSSEDRNFVVRLVAMLENYEPFLKLCVFERDFQVGSAISECVLQSVALSRRTLLVVSDAFARSQWCRWEATLAQHQRIFGDEGALVIVKLGEVPGAHLTPTLRHLLRTRLYLEWDPEPGKQRLFWQKLRAALSPPAISVKAGDQ
ncbi:toll-like receptor 4, partial [Schistocerca nitens]|uniref:toll-like receptor 4 n=1 Tax=Schistocerca nitens TaxID=7011 RepID=UPI0021198560